MQQVATEPAGEELSLAERAYRAIRDRLVMLEIRPGAPINEDQLAQSLGVGRTPVREALKRLQYERLITTYPRRGTFATEVNITDLAHISEVRQELEPLAAALAARRATAADRATLTAALRELEGADSPQRDAAELMRLDLQVHRAIYAATHNPYLEDTLVRHDNLATRIWCLFIDRLSDMAGHIGEHGPLIEAVVAGDPDKAAQLAHSHVEGFERAIRAAI
ncbi:GntR family transcriptional regulator [Streptomyces iranensis]|uniref:DNA-binding GntR family transcriptional regulator n=1 Tax=Streptomyces iranensis TaxID=576784 RepID=A0A060ZCJ6_9ACTN|nr:GntR family transcriptional regulator [Streptomyces iranensis]MBP2063290.1 DNA-binding GntR family transcriptional regulator [Streptomyces iranensis]CDR01864.1 transcriptional regulator, GntR family protein [Streptomyces iranensis]